MTVPRMLERVGEAAGLDLRCTDDFTDAPLIVSVRDEPVSEVLDRIAEVCEGRWTVGQGIYTLNARPMREEDSDYAVRVSAIAETLAANHPGQAARAEDAIAFFDALEAAISADGQLDYVKSQEVLKQHPGATVLYKLAALFGPETLAAIPENRPVVFSSQPTQFQRQLPGGVEGLIAQQHKDLQLFDQVRQGRSYNAQNAPAQIRHYYTPPVMQERSPQLVWVKVRRFQSSLSFQLLGFVSEPQARPVIIAGSFPFRDSGPAKGLETRYEWPSVPGEITLSDEAKEWVQWWASRFTSSIKAPEPANREEPLYWRVLTQKDPRDYLGFYHSEGMLAAAKQLERPMIARLNPAGSQNSYLRMAETYPVPMLLGSALSGSHAYQDGRWLLARPADLKQSREMSIRRTAVAAMLANSEPKGEIVFADLLAAADGCPDERAYASALEFALKAKSDQPGGMGSPDAKALYAAGLLGAVHQRRLITSGEAAIRQDALSDRAEAAIFDMLIQDIQLADTQGAAYLNALKHSTPEEMADYRGFDMTTPAHEPTWLMGQSGMSPYEASFTYERQDLFRRKASGKPLGDTRLYSLLEMAQQAVMDRMKNEAGIPATEFDETYLYSHQPSATVTMTIRFDGRYQGRMRTAISLQPSLAEFNPPHLLPEPLKARYDELFRKEYQRMTGKALPPRYSEN